MDLPIITIPTARGIVQVDVIDDATAHLPVHLLRQDPLLRDQEPGVTNLSASKHLRLLVLEELLAPLQENTIAIVAMMIMIVVIDVVMMTIDEAVDMTDTVALALPHAPVAIPDQSRQCNRST